MQEAKFYYYAVVRLVPRIEREEFFNVGLILFSKRDQFIRLEYHLDADKFKMLCPNVEYEDVAENLETLRQISLGNAAYGPIARLEIPERFRWLTAVRSSVVQTSPQRSGKTDNLDKTFDRLFDELVR